MGEWWTTEESGRRVGSRRFARDAGGSAGVEAATEAGTGPPRWRAVGSERQVVVGAEQIELGVGIGVELRIDQGQ